MQRTKSGPRNDLPSRPPEYCPKHDNKQRTNICVQQMLPQTVTLTSLFVLTSEQATRTTIVHRHIEKRRPYSSNEGAHDKFVSKTNLLRLKTRFSCKKSIYFACSSSFSYCSLTKEREKKRFRTRQSRKGFNIQLSLKLDVQCQHEEALQMSQPTHLLLFINSIS